MASIRGILAAFGCAIAWILFTVPPASAEKRVALVIGNDAYANLPRLRNAVSDARAVRDALHGLGFEVLYGENLGRRAMVDRLFDLAARLSQNDIAFFFFAGHGVAFSGANYLLPADLPAPRASGRAEEGRLAEQAVAEATVIERLAGSGARVSVLVLDACRNNPLQGSDRRSLGSARGLSQSQPARGVFSIYSAGHNQEALDRLGPDDTHPNSVFTRVFIEKLKLPGIDLKVVATETRRAVAALAEKVGHEQYPAYYDQILGGDVYLAGRATAVLPAPSVTPAPLLRADPCAAAAEHWRSAEAINSKSAFDDHLARFPNCAFAGLARAKIEALAKSTEDRNKVAVVTPPLPPPAPPTPVKPAVGVTEQAPKASLAEKPAYPFEPDVLRVAVSPPSRPTPARGLLKAVKARGKLKCGINGNLPGFSAIGARGDWAGIDVDFCRAVAAAIFGDQRKVEFIRLTPTDRFTALQAGQVDVLSRNTSRTDDRESKLGLQFVGVNFYDGIAFLVPKSLGVGNVRQLDGVSICMHAGTVMELVVVEYFRNHRLRLTPVKYSTINEGIAAYDSRRCDTFVSDGSALSMMKGRTGKRDQHEILPDRLTKEALGPWVRQGDDQWLTLLRWALFAMIKAEELGITSGNIAARLASSDPATRRLLGRDGQLGRRLGVDDNWAVNIIKLVGNYGEVYARGVAAGHAISPERGMNALQRDGGLVAAPDIR